MPKVSVIIPTYNQSRMVQQAIESVLRQTHNDLEILVVNDGSTDDTEEVIKKIKDDRVKYFYKKNGGGASARNYAFDRISGEFAAFLDHDDLWRENHLKEMLGALNSNPEYGIAYCQYENHSPDGKTSTGVAESRYFSGAITKHYYGKMPDILPSTTVFRSDVLRGFYHDESAENAGDIELFLRMSAKIKFLFVPSNTVIRRLTVGSMTYNSNDIIFYTVLNILERFYYVFGGDKVVPERLAMKKLGRLCRGIARKHLKLHQRKAALYFLNKAIEYCPFNLKYYKDTVRALLISKKTDTMPNWQTPKTLPPYIIANGRIYKGN